MKMSDNEDNNLLLEMNDGDETNESSLPKNITERTKQVYERTYIHFTEWQKKNNMSSISENVLLAYFNDMSKIYSPPTLFGKFSMLKSTLNIFMNTDISNYNMLRKFLKQRSVGYTAKKSNIFTPSDISNFIENAPDEVYLLMKTAVIFGVMGACQRQELHGVLFENVTDSNGSLLVKIMKNATDFDRSFTITGKYYNIVKKYMNMRPRKCKNKHFFLKYCTYKDKCSSQNLGINTFGNMGKVVATYLKLENPELYTGHCFRRTSATMLIGSGGDIMPLQSPCLISKRFTTAIRNSMQNKLHESSSPCNSKNRESPRSDICSEDSRSGGKRADGLPDGKQLPPPMDTRNTRGVTNSKSSRLQPKPPPAQEHTRDFPDSKSSRLQPKPPSVQEHRREKRGNQRQPATEQCRFCGVFKECAPVAQKPYHMGNKVSLALNHLRVDLDFTIESLPKTVCRDCDTKLLETFEFIKQVNTAQFSLVSVSPHDNASSANNQAHTYTTNDVEINIFKAEFESDEEYNDETNDIDNSTLGETIYLKENHKRKNEDNTTKTQKKKKVKDKGTKKIDVDIHSEEFIMDIKEEIVELDDSNGEESSVELDDLETDVKPCESELSESDCDYQIGNKTVSGGKRKGRASSDVQSDND